MMLSSGILLTPDNINDPDTRIDLEDILVGLSRQPRFAGHTRRWWTVLHHTLVCHFIGIRADEWLGLDSLQGFRAHLLMHDAHETVLGDIPGTWKMTYRKALEEDIDEVIFRSFNMPTLHADDKAIVRWVDRQALAAEAEVLGPVGAITHYTIPAASPTAVEVVESIAHAWEVESDREALINFSRMLIEKHVIRPFRERTTELF